uniref:Transcobalamin-2 n=1 Tax=Anser cygnoides TaxID=8845 RepID=A0A8B9E0N2_ANSCY
MPESPQEPGVSQPLVPRPSPPGCRAQHVGDGVGDGDSVGPSAAGWQLPSANPAACRDTRAAAQWPETGRLALYLLGLRATCPPPDPSPQRFLVTWLKYYLEKDWEGSRRHGHPLTSYYQYSLGVLALCVHRKRVREEVIQRLLVAEQHRRFRHAGHTGVDTEAVAALAFACLEREQLVRSSLAAELRAAVRGIRARFVAVQSEDGFIGNVFSTPLAMQVCAGAGPAYGRAMAALLQRLDAFTSAAAMAQALPALHGRSYLDIASMQCKEELGRSWGQGGGKGQGGWHRAGTDATVVAVLAPHPPLPPRFETQDTPQGPFLTSVLGLAAQPQERHYWQLLGGLGTSLQMGVADYRPEDGETVVLRLSKW